MNKTRRGKSIVCQKKLDRKILAFQKTENRVFEPNLELCEIGVDHRADYLKERKDFLDGFREKVESERGKHQIYMQETQRITLNGFQTGFCRIFEASIEFSKGSIKMYNDLVGSSQEEDENFSQEELRNLKIRSRYSNIVPLHTASSCGDYSGVVSSSPRALLPLFGNGDGGYAKENGQANIKSTQVLECTFMLIHVY
ncbi:unnamed protein product [Lactuca saligna]|uniref:Uncharacterized protein n=1 Tax=Lactuca saligna TaxID=75948 RepID=A0AA36E1W9_LACSI|nr:unnamed protein product [Lactuca saligna]